METDLKFVVVAKIGQQIFRHAGTVVLHADFDGQTQAIARARQRDAVGVAEQHEEDDREQHEAADDRARAP